MVENNEVRGGDDDKNSRGDGGRDEDGGNGIGGEYWCR